MINNEYIDLMNQSIDEVISSDDQARLDAYLDRHSDAQGYFNNLRFVAGTLNRVERVDPPDDMKQSILDTIRTKKNFGQTRPLLLEKIVRAFKTRAAWRFAYTFAAGIVCGIVVLNISLNVPESSSKLDTKDLVGSILPAPSLDNHPSIDKRIFSLNEINGRVETRVIDGIIVLLINAVSENELRIDVSFEEMDISFIGFRQVESHVKSLESSPTSVTISHRGESRYTLFFAQKRQAESHLTCSFSSGDLIQEEVITIGYSDE
jgi:hypothetical protein